MKFSLIVITLLAVFAVGILVDCLPLKARCWLSRYIDLHDYPMRKGGDGVPTHFYTYTCWRCGKRFSI